MTWLPDFWVLAALVVVGTTSGLLGCFALLRRQSLLGDTLAHAALPGVCLAYLLTGSKDPGVLLIGALISGAVGSLFLLGLRASRLKQDAALGLVLSTFFGLGIMLLALLQKRPDAKQSGLEDFIFGQAAYLTRDHLRLMLPIGLAALLVVVLFYKELKLFSFDPDYAGTIGFSRRILEVVLALLMVAAVMISLRAIGVVLTTALLVVPAAAARQWTERLSLMLVLGVAFGALAGIGGTIWSEAARKTPTGPAVTLVATAFLAVSVTLAPRRGVVWHWLRLRSHRAKVRRENLLTDFYRLGEADQDWQTGCGLDELAGQRGQAAARTKKTLGQLSSLAQVARAAGLWRLTETGLAEAARLVRAHRLWELYLTRRLDLPADHVHRDAEEMEHALPPELIRELESQLGQTAQDPHGRALPEVPIGP